MLPKPGENIYNTRKLMWILQNNYIIPTVPKFVFVGKYINTWDPQIHSPCNYLQIFYVAALIDECGTNNHYPLEMFRNGISKNTRSSYKGTINDETPLSSSDSEMASKIKIFCENFPCHV